MVIFHSYVSLPEGNDEFDDQLVDYTGVSNVWTQPIRISVPGFLLTGSFHILRVNDWHLSIGSNNLGRNSHVFRVPEALLYKTISSLILIAWKIICNDTPLATTRVLSSSLLKGFFRPMSPIRQSLVKFYFCPVSPHFRSQWRPHRTPSWHQTYHPCWQPRRDDRSCAECVYIYIYVLYPYVYEHLYIFLWNCF